PVAVEGVRSTLTVTPPQAVELGVGQVKTVHGQIPGGVLARLLVDAADQVSGQSGLARGGRSGQGQGGAMVAARLQSQSERVGDKRFGHAEELMRRGAVFRPHGRSGRATSEWKG